MNQIEHILRLENVSVGFHDKEEDSILLQGISIGVHSGELIGLIGRNGSGKSTLIRSLVRLQKLLHGTISIRGRNSRDIIPNEFAQIMAYVSSGLEYAESMTVQELVSLGRFPYTNWIGQLLPVDIEFIREALIRVGISHLSERKLSEISDGERQKAMIARTLAQDTPLIILDEPTAFLDLPSKYDIISLLYELTRKGKTVIYSTHDLNIALRFSDKIWLIDHKKIHDGSPEDLVIDKTISGIFESEKILFNEMAGDFELRKHPGKKLCLISEIQNLEYWTRRALQRTGYEVVDYDASRPVISVEKHNNKIIWKIQSFNEILIFESIYDMLSALK